MKIKLLLFSMGLLGFSMAHANNNPDPGPATCDKKGKKMISLAWSFMRIHASR